MMTITKKIAANRTFDSMIKLMGERFESGVFEEDRRSLSRILAGERLDVELKTCSKAYRKLIEMKIDDETHHNRWNDIKNKYLSIFNTDYYRQYLQRLESPEAQQ